MVPRHHRSRRCSRHPCVSELRLMMPRRLTIVVQSGGNRRCQMTVAAAMAMARNGCVEGNCVGDAVAAAVTAASTMAVKVVAR